MTDEPSIDLETTIERAEETLERIPHTILSGDGSHLYLRDPNGRRVGPVHPTWRMDYGDGRDYGAETNARIHAFNKLVNESTS
jgi:predicted RNA binding protein YcfA (HicA-like mRNA interferase family)